MRVLFTATPGWGHVHPMVPLARALLDRGDDVSWAVGADVVPRLAGAGFRAVPAGLGGAEGMREYHRRFPEMAGLPRPAWPDFMFPRLFGAVRA
ncbi:MAG TPA: hypothetical protein VFO65_02895, partial [Acidimicrobiales bacterium]|nr:hypothetical protein [Acidimicrobiales bacterium]